MRWAAAVLALIALLPGVGHGEAPAPRPAPPAIPWGYAPSDDTMAAAAPASTPGNMENIPWWGGFWLTAPDVTVGVCGIYEEPAHSVAEAAIQRWNDAAARGLGWRLVRDDAACAATYAGPRLLIKRELMSTHPNIVGQTTILDAQGNDCRLDMRGTTCWVGTALVVLNPLGFDTLKREQQLGTAVHEIGHALGLAHARACGDTAMWSEVGGCGPAAVTAPGMDDICSMNALLAVTLRTLR